MSLFKSFNLNLLDSFIHLVRLFACSACANDQLALGCMFAIIDVQNATGGATGIIQVIDRK